MLVAEPLLCGCVCLSLSWECVQVMESSLPFQLMEIAGNSAGALRMKTIKPRHIKVSAAVELGSTHFIGVLNTNPVFSWRSMKITNLCVSSSLPM